MSKCIPDLPYLETIPITFVCSIHNFGVNVKKAIHAQESKKASREQAKTIVELGENLRHQYLAGGLLLAIGALGNIVAMAVQRDQRPDGAVGTLCPQIGHVG